MTQLFNFIKNQTSGKKVFMFFILTNLLYAFMLLVSIPKVMSYSNDLKILDMIPTGYDITYVNRLFEALGETGRQAYLTNQLPLDMIYPLLFGISYCLILGYFLKKLNIFKTPYQYFCLLPILAGIADYIENIGIITLLKNFPDISEYTVNMTEFFSLVKSIATSIYFTILIAILFLYALNTILKKYVL